jgi:hypothetical protein
VEWDHNNEDLCVSLLRDNVTRRGQTRACTRLFLVLAATFFYTFVDVANASHIRSPYADDIFGLVSDVESSPNSEANEVRSFRRSLFQAEVSEADASSATPGDRNASKSTGVGTKNRKRKKRKATGLVAGGENNPDSASGAEMPVERATKPSESNSAAVSDSSSTVSEGNLEQAETSNDKAGTGSETKPSEPNTGSASAAGKGATDAIGEADDGLPSLRTANEDGVETQAGSERSSREEEIESGGPESALRRVTRLRMEKNAKTVEYYRMVRHVKYLQKSLELKRGESEVASSQVELDEDEIKVSTRQLQAIREGEEMTNATYNELRAVTKEMGSRAKTLAAKADTISDLTHVMAVRLQHLTVEEVLANSARGLPDSVAGALRRSAEALTPFMDTLMIAADTNQRLVDHVGAEIDKYTHVNIRKSPFLSGLLFYCVLLVPTLTLVSFARRVFDSSSKLTVSHFIILGNVYYMAMCIAALVSTWVMRADPAASLHKTHEKVFVSFNLLLGVYYLWHIGMMTLQAAYTRETRNTAQLVATLCIGVHYFLFTWRRVFTKSSPQMIAANYGMYLTILAIITVERLTRLDMHLWFTRRHLLSTAASRDSNGDETSLGTIVSLLATMASDAAAMFSLSTALPTPKVGAKSKWEGGARHARDRRPLLRSSLSQEDTDGGGDRDLEAIFARRPQSARHPGVPAATGNKRRYPAERVKERGFAAIFFGSRDGDHRDDTSSEEDGDIHDNTGGAEGSWWSQLGRVTGYTAAVTTTSGGARERAGCPAHDSATSRRVAPNYAVPRQSYFASWFGGTTMTRRDQ